MRTAEECLAKAAEMEAKAASPDASQFRAEFLSVAKAWRDLAPWAAWQDGF